MGKLKGLVLVSPVKEFIYIRGPVVVRVVFVADRDGLINMEN